MKQYHVLISAENTKQANTILDALLKKRLVLGGPVLRGPARFWWKGKIVKMDYSFILTYTIDKHRKAITETVKKVSIEEIPMISFFPFEGNASLLRLIHGTVK